MLSLYGFIEVFFEKFGQFILCLVYSEVQKLTFNTMNIEYAERPMTASQLHYWEMGSGEWVAVAYLAYMGEPPLLYSLMKFEDVMFLHPGLYTQILHLQVTRH